MSTVAINLKGSLDGPVLVDDDFAGLANQMNMANAQGRMFVVLEDTNANPVIVNLHEILTVRELEDDDPLCLQA